MMESLKLYYETLKLSPRDPNYIPQLEEAAFQMSKTIEELSRFIHEKIDELE